MFLENKFNKTNYYLILCFILKGEWETLINIFLFSSDSFSCFFGGKKSLWRPCVIYIAIPILYQNTSIQANWFISRFSIIPLYRLYYFTTFYNILQMFYLFSIFQAIKIVSTLKLEFKKLRTYSKWVKVWLNNQYL